MAAYTPLMTHGQRLERRRAVAADALAGMTYPEVAAKHGVSVATVYAAVRENRTGADAKPRSLLSETTWQALRLLLDGRRYADIAAQLGCSERHIRRVRECAVRHGILQPGPD